MSIVAAIVFIFLFCKYGLPILADLIGLTFSFVFWLIAIGFICFILQCLGLVLFRADVIVLLLLLFLLSR